MFYGTIAGHNLMMTSYFSSLNAQSCYLIFLVWWHFSKVSFRDGHNKLALTLDLFFISFSRYFCTFIFPPSLSSFRFFRTPSFQLVCDNVLFTLLSLLNITDNTVVINKLRQDKSSQALRCSGERFCGLWSVWYRVYFFYGRLNYSYLYWGCDVYFHLQNLLLCITCKNSRLVLWGYNWERYFCVSFGMFSESDVFIITTVLGVSLVDKS